MNHRPPPLKSVTIRDYFKYQFTLDFVLQDGRRGWMITGGQAHDIHIYDPRSTKWAEHEDAQIQYIAIFE
jgi:hypothetical protein